MEPPQKKIKLEIKTEPFEQSPGSSGTDQDFSNMGKKEIKPEIYSDSDFVGDEAEIKATKKTEKKKRKKPESSSKKSKSPKVKTKAKTEVKTKVKTEKQLQQQPLKLFPPAVPSLPRSACSQTGGFNKQYKLSDELAEIVGEDEANREELRKLLWAYIKENGLQDPKNKHYFTPDKKMAKVFGKERLGGFAMQKFLPPHLSPPRLLSLWPMSLLPPFDE